MDSVAASPSHDALAADLAVVREKGIVRLRQLTLPALSAAVRATGQISDDAIVDAPAIEHLIRCAVDGLGGGRLGDCAAVLFGLEVGVRDEEPHRLREDAAERWGVGVSRFRHAYQPLIIEQLADQILGLVHQRRLRRARLDADRKTPVGSRLAIEWLARFESYYAIWTPISGLGNDLTAIRATLLDADKPSKAGSATDAEVTPEDQATMYATSALFHYVAFHVALSRFQHHHGGLWLASDAAAETDLADAVYRIGWHSPFTQRDDSYLRDFLVEHCRGELHRFVEAGSRDRITAAHHATWVDWADACRCEWPVGERPTREPFPTHRGHPTIAPICPLHAMVAACGDYMMILDDDWDRIADWYHIDERRPVPDTAEQRYTKEPP